MATHEWMTGMALDAAERSAIRRYLDTLKRARLEPTAAIEEGSIHRGADGRIVIPVTLDAEDPSLSLGMLMAEKSEALYRHTGCRLVIEQRPLRDPSGRRYFWDGQWMSVG